MPSGHFVTDKYTFNGLPFNDVLATVLATVESPICWRINDEKSYKNRLYGIEYWKRDISFDKFIELRVTSSTFLILFSVREFYEGNLRLYIYYFFDYIAPKPFRAILPAIFCLFAKTSKPIVTSVSSAF